jgi:hypothetical protein
MKDRFLVCKSPTICQIHGGLQALGAKSLDDFAAGQDFFVYQGLLAGFPSAQYKIHLLPLGKIIA